MTPPVTTTAGTIPASGAIPLRPVSFTFDPAEVPRDWYEGDPFSTAILDALSLLFPEGERFFVDSVKQLRARVDAAELQDRITGFIGQEAMHGRAHRALNELLHLQSYDATPELEADLRQLLVWSRRMLSPHAQLAVTCALEHFTAILSEMLLREEGARAAMHPAVRPLWLWHAFEETEHKAVAFDVYRATGGSELLRIVMMLATTAIFFAQVDRVLLRFLAARGLLRRPWRWGHGLSRQWIRPGYFRMLIPAYLSYYRPGFHPDDRDTRALLGRWREQLFGEDGELRSRLRTAAPEAA